MFGWFKKKNKQYEPTIVDREEHCIVEKCGCREVIRPLTCGFGTTWYSNDNFFGSYESTSKQKVADQYCMLCLCPKTRTFTVRVKKIVV